MAWKLSIKKRNNPVNTLLTGASPGKPSTNKKCSARFLAPACLAGAVIFHGVPAASR